MGAMGKRGMGFLAGAVLTAVAARAESPGFGRPPRLVDHNGKIVGTVVATIDPVNTGGVPAEVWRRDRGFVVSLHAYPTIVFPILQRPLLHATADCSGTRYLSHRGGFVRQTSGIPQPAGEEFWYPSDPVQTLTWQSCEAFEYSPSDCAQSGFPSPGADGTACCFHTAEFCGGN